MEKYDVIIIGAGPAGLTAGIYAGRYKLKTLIIGKLLGGMISEAHEVCNFPTHDKIPGFELVQKMSQQVENLEVGIRIEDIQEIKKQDNFYIKTSANEYKTKKIIIATGTKKNKLNIPGEKEFIGKGVSYCATCDGAFYKNKTVGVIGGSNAALTAALLLSKYAKKVYIIYRKDKFFRAEPSWIEQVENNSKIESLFNTKIKEIYGNKEVEGVKLHNNKDIKLDGVFIEIGSTPDTKISKQLNLETEDNYIKVNKKQQTNVKGISAAGDITNNPLKQVVTACGEGATAADSAYKELLENV